MKLKPQSYSGTDDLEDFLVQFNILAEINGWDYKIKSLYLANSLSGPARSILSEMAIEERRDYGTLVQKLNGRFGSANRTEMFRAQLKSRVLGKDGCISALSVAVRKLVRLSYPNASSNLIETLAIDHFTDALIESDIRLRLREISPKSLAEAETIAFRMNALKIVDRQHASFARKTELETDSSNNIAVLQNQPTLMSENLNALERQFESCFGNNALHDSSVYSPHEKNCAEYHRTRQRKYRNPTYMQEQRM